MIVRGNDSRTLGKYEAVFAFGYALKGTHHGIGEELQITDVESLHRNLQNRGRSFCAQGGLTGGLGFARSLTYFSQGLGVVVKGSDLENSAIADVPYFGYLHRKCFTVLG